MSAGMVIVGAGECGLRAAFALREEGYDGPVTLVGDEPHAPYERPPLSKERLASGVMAAEPKPIAEPARLREAGIRLLLSQPVALIDRTARCVRLADDTRLPFETLLLATGARPRRLPLAEGLAHALYMRTHEDATRLAARLDAVSSVAIVGGGFIGLELAAAARGRGLDVTVIEAQSRLLARAVPPDMSEHVLALHRRHGVRVLTGTGIAAMADTPDGVALDLADGTRLECGVAVIGIGAVPNTELAEAAGLACDNGVLVDDQLRTDDPAILAAGDCCSFPLALYGGRRVRLEAWRNAQEQGALAARNMLGRREAHAHVPWFWSDQFEATLQIAGLSGEASRTVRRPVGEDGFILFHLDGDGRLVAASGIGPGNAVARDVRLAEMLIARRAAPPPAALAAPETKLKTLLAA